MKYPDVKNAHIVPATYLENWAVDGKLAVRLVGKAQELLLSPENAGTRRRFYRRTRPKDGTPIDDVEWSLSVLEGRTAPLLRTVADRWPLDRDDKAALAQFFSHQFVRGPRWMEFHQRFTEDFIAEQRRAGWVPDDQPGSAPAEALAEFESHLLGSTARLTQMLEFGMKLAITLGSMQWALVEFSSPVLATSDHPVVPWPLAASARRPETTPFNVGVMECLEFAVPLSPRQAILMIWLDTPDVDAPRVRGARHHAARLNAFAIAQADRQWFHAPGTSPPRATGSLLPLSADLVRGYDSATGAESQRRAMASELVQPLIGKTMLPTDEIPMVVVSPGNSFTPPSEGRRAA